MAEISREEHAPAAPVIARALDFEQHEARPENMTGDQESGAEPRGDLDRLARIGDRLKSLEGGACVLFRVERKRRGMRRQAMTVAIRGFLFLQARRVGQQYLEQIGRPART